MDSLTYANLLKCSSAGITDYFAAAYSYEYGEKKAKEVLKNVTNSKKVGNLLTQAYNIGRFPSSKEILATLNGSTYFIFSKAETLCLASLCIVIIFENEMKKLCDEINYLYENTSLCVDIISDTNKLKINQSGVYERFLDSIKSADLETFSVYESTENEEDNPWGDYYSEIGRGK